MRNGTAGRTFAAAGRAPLAWRVLGFTSDASGAMVRLRGAGGLWAECGHNHADQAEAEACPWEPSPPPATYAGRVCQVRADRPATAAAATCECGAPVWRDGRCMACASREAE